MNVSTHDIGRQKFAFFSVVAALPRWHAIDIDDVTNFRFPQAINADVGAKFSSIGGLTLYHFSENAWNDMILKALFIRVLLDPNQGIDTCSNPKLARILHYYANKRWAANRSVQLELWRCVGPFSTGSNLDDLERVFKNGNTTELKAIALALKAAPPSDRKVELKKKIEILGEDPIEDEFDWAALANEMQANSLATTRKLDKEVELQQ